MTNLATKLQKQIATVEAVIAMGVKSIEKYKIEIAASACKQEKQELTEDMQYLVQDNEVQKAKVFAWRGVLNRLT